MTHPDLHSYQKQLLQQRDDLRARLNQLRGGEPSRALASVAAGGAPRSPHFLLLQV